ncbi:hypothetical protein ORIO_04580 [Cereibacter azotoformans]|uniref:Uncharacterized protein n=2 Tax=Cereibacter TaxID=1653176 RepID=A0A2T5K0J2_9RHOB|nr:MULTISPECIES: hypothetical protein [Cereibacter]AXQ93056.1 hypothetical protein D0Z66_04070 [Cereibacter sphaeroides]MBO4169250.1 hypothetical protein [Cereibacter azotoformans]PTR15858.1 hypothetical protein C8J28_1135 [Cereibacter azotoformans]UIJ31360.1 hypothetical protein LV780_04075 [Cereibacter azotoformans]ULB09197.1 hypothetical protein ORIO_04580 [Cereibacter azotoformans]
MDRRIILDGLVEFETLALRGGIRIELSDEDERLTVVTEFEEADPDSPAGFRLLDLRQEFEVRGRLCEAGIVLNAGGMYATCVAGRLGRYVAERLVEVQETEGTVQERLAAARDCLLRHADDHEEEVRQALVRCAFLGRTLAD